MVVPLIGPDQNDRVGGARTPSSHRTLLLPTNMGGIGNEPYRGF